MIVDPDAWWINPDDPNEVKNCLKRSFPENEEFIQLKKLHYMKLKKEYIPNPVYGNFYCEDCGDIVHASVAVEDPLCSMCRSTILEKLTKKYRNNIDDDDNDNDNDNTDDDDDDVITLSSIKQYSFHKHLNRMNNKRKTVKNRGK